MIYQPESFYSTTLTAAITASQTTIAVVTPPTITSGFLVIEASSSNREIIKYTGVVGSTLTGVTRGLASYGSDTTGGTGKAHPAGVEVANKDVHYYYAQYYDFLTGTSATGTNNMRIGDGNTISASNRFWYVHTSSLSAYFGLSSDGNFVASKDGITAALIGNSFNISGFSGGEGVQIATSAINGTSFRSKARRTSGSLNVGNQLTFDVLDINIYSEMTSASFTAGSNGLYWVNCSYHSYQNFGHHGIQVKKNGSVFQSAQSPAYTGDTSYGMISINTVIPLSTNESLTFFSYTTNTAEAIFIGSGTYEPRLEIIKLI